MMSRDPLLEPFKLGRLTLKNRILSTSHAPAFAEQGHPRDRYRLYHEEKAKGGVALTMIGGSTNISPDSPSVFGQLYAGDDSIIPWFEKLTTGVKNHGAAIMCQLTHMGRRTVTDQAAWLPAIGPSDRRERAHRCYPKAMEQSDFARVIGDFAAAAKRCQQGGFDGIELLSHSHLLGQFLSPLINDRLDDYGGSLENRLRLTLQVLEAVRGEVGSDFILGMRLTATELTQGGLSIEEGVEVAKRLNDSGMLDFINVLAGAPYDDLGLSVWVPPMGQPTAPHLDIVSTIRQAVALPIFHAGGIADVPTARHAIKQNIVDMVGMTRAQIADPYLVSKLIENKEDDIRPCVGLGYCVDRVNQGKDALCGHNAASGRESQLPHRFTTQITHPAKTVVVGGGPAGMEAARVLASRGFKVTLFEANNQLGGQLVLAARGQTRRQIIGVSDWLQSQIERLGVDIHMNCYAEQTEILAEQPDLVVIATGGMPTELAIPGAELARSSWDPLLGEVFEGDALIFDDHGDQQAAVTAEVLSNTTQSLTLITPDRTPLLQLGPTNSAVVMRGLYSRKVTFDCDQDLTEISRRDNRLCATLKNTLTGETKQVTVDHIFVENATKPLNDVYLTLKPLSRNEGTIDVAALSQNKIVLPITNVDGKFDLIRMGDAIANRHLHAAIYDALRICSKYEKQVG